MNELEQLRAQLIELTAENERLRGALSIYRKPEHWMPITEDAPSDRLIVTKTSAYVNGHGYEIAQEALSQPTPTGFGEKVLALTRATVQYFEWFIFCSDSPKFERVTRQNRDNMQQAAQPFIESAELRQQLEERS